MASLTKSRKHNGGKCRRRVSKENSLRRALWPSRSRRPITRRWKCENKKQLNWKRKGEKTASSYIDWEDGAYLGICIINDTFSFGIFFQALADDDGLSGVAGKPCTQAEEYIVTGSCYFRLSGSPHPPWANTRRLRRTEFYFVVSEGRWWWSRPVRHFGQVPRRLLFFFFSAHSQPSSSSSIILYKSRLITCCRDSLQRELAFLKQEMAIDRIKMAPIFFFSLSTAALTRCVINQGVTRLTELLSLSFSLLFDRPRPAGRRG